MEITNKLKQRYCKDCGIPITLYIEPYFTDRLELYNDQFDTLNKYKLFLESLEGYANEQDYLSDYNKVKDVVIMDIKNSSGYARFLEDDFNNYSVNNRGVTDKDVFKETNIGKTLMSIDMVKANFTAMRHYDPTIFNGLDTYEQYISQFTTNEHIINSKYIRQVIFGNNNPRRQVTYQKYLMGKVLDNIMMLTQEVLCYTNDEIVLDITNTSESTLDAIRSLVSNTSVPLRIEEYVLYKLSGDIGYVKEFLTGGYEFKCVDGLFYPFILRKYSSQEPTENDKVFIHNGMLAKLIDVPEVTKK